MDYTNKLTMEKPEENDKILLPHHVQRELCVTRPRYRQGRKLTAVKVYSIAKESNHLLIFGVPSINLLKEARMLFLKFGKLLQFSISKDHASEAFTETYHAQYEKVYSARKAKRVLDTNNFFGGSLHVCYAPELESVTETREKITQRRNEVLYRLRKLEKEDENDVEECDSKTECSNIYETQSVNKNLLNMGEHNVIKVANAVKINKRKINNTVGIEKRFKPCFVDKSSDDDVVNDNNVDGNEKAASSNVKKTLSDVVEVEVVDCTSIDKTTVSNINEALNYNKFGDEVVFKLPTKPVNKIKFNVNKNL